MNPFPSHRSHSQIRLTGLYGQASPITILTYTADISLFPWQSCAREGKEELLRGNPVFPWCVLSYILLVKKAGSVFDSAPQSFKLNNILFFSLN